MSTRPGLTPDSVSRRSVDADSDLHFLPGNSGIEQAHLEERLLAVEEDLSFERVITDIAGLAGTDPGVVDRAVTDSLRQVVEALGVDRAVVWRRMRGEPTVVSTHSWVRPTRLAPPPHIPVTACPWVFSKLDAGERVSFGNVGEIDSQPDRDAFQRHGLLSAAILPISSGDRGDTQRVLSVSSMTEECEWRPGILERLGLVAAIIGQALANQDTHAALHDALDEVRRLRERLVEDNRDPRREQHFIRSTRSIVSESAAIKRVLAQVDQVAPTPATVLLLGETGSGKEVFAQAIHDLSPRHQRPMVKVSCAAIPGALIESELFGRERGAYTGALSRQIGRFEAAHQSTLFLDEIGDLPAEVQVKLLRVLQDKVIERLGSTQSIKVDVRIIAATNRNLERAIQDRTFREDLFYRLNVFPIVVPPLRDRVEDIPGLTWAFIDEFSKSFAKPVVSISKESVHDLQRYSWPGNVRELRNIIERAVIVATGPQLEISAPRPTVFQGPQSAVTLVELEIDHIRTVLESTNWRVRGAGGAAERLGLKPTTLESRMARFGIKRRPA